MTREVSLDDIRKKFNQLGTKDDEDAANVPTFAIVNEKAEQQLLQINLTPASMIYVRANKVYANSRKIKTKKVKNNKVADFFNIFNGKEPVKMLINDTPALYILGCKHHHKQGHIFILDLGVYRESFYYNWGYLIASRIEPQDKQKHPLGASFRML